MDVIDMLKEEHRAMARLLKAFERQLDLLAEAQHPDYDVIDGVLQYCRDFPDRYHHPKEDLLLERLLMRQPEASEKIGDLYKEHEELAELTKRLGHSFDSLLNEAEISREGIVTLGRDFLQHYWDHMRKEEEVFLPLAREVLSESDLRQVDSKIESSPDPLFGPEVDARFDSLREHILAWDREDREAAG